MTLPLFGHGWLGLAAAPLAVVLLFDVAMLGWAIAEKRRAGAVGPSWVRETQVLEPAAPARSRSVVLVHGFVGSPFDLEPLAVELARRGFRVVVPVVPSQTGTTFAYARGRASAEAYPSWLDTVCAREERRYGRKPLLVGFSMGGTLAALGAECGAADAVVLLAPFFSLPRFDRAVRVAVSGLRFIVPVLPKWGRGQINDRAGYRAYTPGSFLVSLWAYHQVHALAHLARSGAGEIRVPTLLLASESDRVASFEASRDVFSENPAVEVRRVPRANHVLLYDYGHEDVVAAAADFLVARDDAR